MQKPILLTTVFLFLIIYTQSQVIHVPGDFNSIQEGINAASTGDTVLVDNGEYFENLNLLGKNIVLCSNYALTGDNSDILSTVINGSNPIHPDTASCFLVISGEDSTCVIQGFTITGGIGTVWEDEHGPGYFFREGGGILIQYSGPTIKNNRIIGNEAIDDSGITSAGGGAIRSGDGNPRIYNNTVLYNQGKYGAGIVLNYSGAEIKNNIIGYNTGGEDFGGGGIWMTSNGDNPIEIINNTIVHNHSELGGGGMRIWSSEVLVSNNIIWNNTAAYLPQIQGSGTITYNCIEGGNSGTGNIDIPPDFIAGSYILSEESFCVDAGNSEPQFNDPEDISNPGSALYPSRGTLLNDVGVYGGPGSQFLTELIVGIENPQNSVLKIVQVYPIPATNKIMIKANSIIQHIEVLNLLGQHVFMGHPYISQIEIDVSSFEKGIYILKLTSKKMTLFKQVVVN